MTVGQILNKIGDFIEKWTYIHVVKL